MATALSKPRKILLINWRDIHNPEAGGAEIYYHEIFKRFSSEKWEVTVLAHAYTGASSKERIDGIKVIRIGTKFLFNYAVIPFILKYHRRYDVIIEDLNKIPFFTPLYCKSPRIQLVMHLFGKTIYQEAPWPFAAYVHFMEKQIKRFYRNEHFISISQSTADEMRSFGHQDYIYPIVEPGIDCKYFYPSKPKASFPKLVYISRLKKYKNAQFLIRALPKLQQRVPTARLFIAGSGDYLPQLKKLTKQMAIEHSVVFLGRISEEEKRDLLSEATLFVNPSIKEGWGINNIEANLCGTVSLSSNVAGLRDSVKNNETGMLFEYNNVHDFIDKATQLLTDPVLLKRLEQGAKAYGKTFTWDAMSEKMEDALNNILE